ncbi:MAG TPA: metallophosphoesterase [Polyangiaceae bacterium]|nr:metallophosphoesterase [Polyangiaceae bacterium]
MAAILAAVPLFGCMQWSPFETDVDDADRDVTEQNLRALSARSPAGPSWAFAVISDSHGDHDGLAAVVDAIDARRDVSFVVHLGDLSDDGLLVEYETTLRLLRRLPIPFFVLLGNHDTFSNGREIYARMFGVTNFVVPYGGARILCFDSNADATGDVRTDRSWLASQVAEAGPDDLLIYASHSDREADLAVPDLRTRLVLYGHLHRAEFGIRGRVQVVGIPAPAERTYDRVDVTDANVTLSRCDRSTCRALDPG